MGFQGHQQNNSMRSLAIMAVGLVVCLASVGSAETMDVTNPSGISTLINTLGKTMEEEVGNYSILQFNANPDTYSYTFEPTDGYIGDGNYVASVILTEAGSGVNLVTSFNRDPNGGGFINTLDAWYPTGGSYAASWSSTGTHTITFSNPVGGVGFTINRNYLNITIKLFDRFDRQIGSTYLIANNTSGGGSAHSFFGYYNANAAITRIELTAPAANLFNIDDFTVIVNDPVPDGYVVDPLGLDTNINTLGETMEEEVGNCSFDQFNANPSTYNHTFESSDGYDTAIGRVLSVILTEGISGIDLVTDFYKDPGGGGFGNVTTTWMPTGGAYSAAWSSVGTHSMTFDRDVQGVGFTLNRLYIGVDIKLYDVCDVQIGPAYSVAPNGASGHSFFGYYDYDAEIRKVEWTTVLGQYSIDDLTLIIGFVANPDDYDPPIPDPMTWDSAPDANGSPRLVTMTASAAIDESMAEYYFECVEDSNHDSGWVGKRTYIDVGGLTPGTEYTYRVKARDLSPNLNETAWSTAASTTTGPPPVVSDLPDLTNVTGADIDESNVSFVLHVSVDGNDSNPGTLAAPFRTVDKAAQVAAVHQDSNDGVKVIIHPGTYREYCDALMADYNTPDGVTAVMIFEANEQGTAILSGSEVYTGWVRQGSSDIYTHSWTNNWGLFLEPPWDAMANYRGDQFLHNPILRRIEMFFVDGQYLTQVLTYDHYVPHDDPGVTELENSFYVDEDNDLVYIHLPAGSDINVMTIESAQRNYVFGASDIRNLVIRGLVFQHAANTLNIQMDPSGGGDGALYIESGVNVLLENNLFQWNNGTGYSFFGGVERPEGTYYVYYPCEKVTVRRNVSNYNGFSGFELNTARNWIYEDNEESYNNWRGAQGNWEWDDSGRGLGLYSGWTGTRFYRMHFAVIRRHKAIGNHARGIWFDYDNMHILYEDGLLHDNMDGLKFEVNPGPIWIKDTVITDNALSGMYIAVADHTTIENCIITGNGHLSSAASDGLRAQILIDWQYTNHYVGPWDRLISAYFMDMGRWTMFDTVIGGAAANPVMKTTNIAPFMDNQVSENNYWYRSSDANAFVIDTTKYDFDGWKYYTGQDSNSIFASSAPVPSSCGDFGTVCSPADVDEDCSVGAKDLAAIASLWAEDLQGIQSVPWAEDLYYDNQIDFKDIAILTEYWLDSTEP